jgi:hypothetical protein
VFDDDLDIFFEDLPTVQILVEDSSIKGFLDQNGKELTGTQTLGISSIVISVTVQTAQLPDSLPNQTPLVMQKLDDDGNVLQSTNMILRDQLPHDDGNLTFLILEYAP